MFEEFKDQIEKKVTAKIEKDLEKGDNSVKASSTKLNSSKLQAQLISTRLSDSTKIRSQWGI